MEEIIRAANSDTPDQARFMEMPGFDAPAASQYAATTPELLGWFHGYNERQPSGRKVFPFGFLLLLQAKSRIEMAKEEPEALSDELWRRRLPCPAAPYYKRPSEAKDAAAARRRCATSPLGATIPKGGRSRPSPWRRQSPAPRRPRRTGLRFGIARWRDCGCSTAPACSPAPWRPASSPASARRSYASTRLTGTSLRLRPR